MKKFIALMLAGLMVLSFGACKKKTEENSEAEDKYLQEVIDRGVLKVGIVASEVSAMSFIDDKYNIVGFDIELAGMICDYIEENYCEGGELKIQFNPVASNERAKAVSEGEVDIMFGGCVYGSDSEMVYSNGYIKDRIVAVADKEYVSAGEMRGLKVAVMGDEDITAALKAEGAENMTSFNSVAGMLAALEDGSADAAVMSEPAYNYYLTQTYGEDLDKAPFIVGDIGLENKIYAACAKSEAKSIVSAVNKALKSFSEDKSLEALADKWFGSHDCLNLQEN